MQLYEFQAKTTFRKHGIPTPNGLLARTREEAVEAAKSLIDPYLGYNQCVGRHLSARIGFQGKKVVTFGNTVNRLWNVFREHGAELVEVNLVGVLCNGDMVALDAKMTLDDKVQRAN